MINFIIKKPVSVIMIFTALVILGLIAVNKIAKTPLPNIQIPEITVQINSQTVSAKSLQNNVIGLLSNRFSQLYGLKNLNSESRDGYAVLKLQFDFKTDLDLTFIEVNEKIDQVMDQLPKGVQRPKAIKTDAANIPVFHLEIALKDKSNKVEGRDFESLSTFADQVIKRRFEQLPEVAFVDVTGLSGRELFVQPDYPLMKITGLNNEDLISAIQQQNMDFGGIDVLQDMQTLHIQVEGQRPLTLDDVSSIVVVKNGRQFKLSDLAKIGLRSKESKGLFLSDGRRAIDLAIIKQPTANLDDLKENIDQLLRSVRSDYPDITFRQSQDQTALLKYALSTLKQDLMIGSILALTMIFCFLRNWRSAVLVIITIPTSLLITILLFSVFGLTINIVSLSGLVLGVGLMIDNSIIVIENISQQYLETPDFEEACAQGTAGIFRPLISSVLTTCSVFVPLVFLSGIAGALFFDQAMAITLGLFTSLLVSVTLLPTLHLLVNKKKSTPWAVRSDIITKLLSVLSFDFFERLYNKGFHWVFANKVFSVVIVCLLIAANALFFSLLKKEHLPSFNRLELSAHIDWNDNTGIAENSSRVKDLIGHIAQLIDQYSASIGEEQYVMNHFAKPGSTEAELYMKFASQRMADTAKAMIYSYLNKKFPSSTLTISYPKNIVEQVFGRDQKSLVLKIRSREESIQLNDKLKDLGQKLSVIFKKAQITTPKKNKNYVLYADPSVLLRYALSLEDIQNYLLEYFKGQDIGYLSEGNAQTTISLKHKPEFFNNVLSHMVLTNRNGVAVPIGKLLRLTTIEAYKSISSDMGGTFIPIGIESSEEAGILGYLKNHLNGTDYSIEGSYFENRELIAEMSWVIAVSVLLLYFILASQFQSLIQPVIVLLELPISMSGALIMLFCFRSSVNLISLIGLVVMCGIIINDSILKLDTINQLRKTGKYDLMECIHLAGTKRLKSIVMTSLTTILSVVPFMFGSDIGSMLQRPLSLALIGGMIIGTPVSLYFIPLVYWFYYKNEPFKALSQSKNINI
ncbi:Multidrug efflux pump subunit AcrB [Pedobacter suwonensis]|uniref:Multidrug efflux pump subunit AcrB n=1 Tax=Pedobacter suwonensis TaxID=332999 RepID=A0A1I0TQV9_9SPHI|nr:efflux RND transporter permease subunit [Pedobacter suwonensis]SFA54139.1 Multidrug efflux pump subunit AcrB [Pedobacter suwonensis]